MSGPPEAVGGYVVDRLIGVGGQAEVYALSPVANRPPLALKWSRQAFSPPWSDPLAAEYRTLARLRHPQLLTAHDFGYHENRAFLVLDRVDGPMLSEEARDHPAASLAALVFAISPVLSFLHRRGIIHRDLKPANFRWSANSGSDARRLCLLDLGLVSRPRDPAAEGRAGTLWYMAPEVLKEGRADLRSDLYSLGIIFYEWLTGSVPFTGDNPAEIINGHLAGEVRWPQHAVAQVDERVVRVIGQLLEKDPSRRPADVAAMLARFAEAGLPLVPTAIEPGNLVWHRRTTRLNSPELGLPDGVTSTYGGPRTVILAGDPGSGAEEVVESWKQELRILGWSAADRDGRVEATAPGSGTASLVIRTETDPTAVDTLPAGSDACRCLALRAMGETEMTDYLRAVFFDDTCVGVLLPVALRLSSGLPAITDVLIEEWTSAGAVSWQGTSWTVDSNRLAGVATCEGLRQQYRRLLGEVGSPHIRALNAAAVFDVQLNTDVLVEVLQQERVDPGAVDALFARGWLIPATDPDEPLIDARFRWSGLPEVWAADLPPEYRRTLHGRMASALDKRALIWGRRVYRRLARHWWETENYRASCDAALRWVEDAVFIEQAAEAHHFLDLAQAASDHLVPGTEQDGRRARIALARGRTYKTAGAVEEAQRCFRLVLLLARRGAEARLTAEAAKHLGDTYKSTRDHAKGERILRVALRHFHRLRDDAEVSHTLNNLGNIAWVRGEIDRGLEYYDQALGLQRRLGRTADLASTLSNIGAMYLGKCEFGRARECMQESLGLKETLNQPIEVARTLNNLGLVSLYLGEFDGAADCFTRASAINESEGAGESWLLNRRNLLDAWISQAAYRLVVEEAPRLVGKAESLDEWPSRAYAYLFAARAFHELADYRSSWWHLQRVVQLLDRASDPTLFAQHFILLAERQFRFGESDAAVRALVAALEKADSSSDLRDRPEVYLAAAKLEPHVRDMPPELYAAGAEAFRLFEKLGMTHRLFEVLLVTDDDSLTTFGERFPLPDDFPEATAVRYVSPPALKGLWLWRVARKAVNDGDNSRALKILDTLHRWCEPRGSRELGWRALAMQGNLYHAAHDWELAARAFTHAVQTLDAVAQTIEPPEARARYLAAQDVRRLYAELEVFSSRFAER